MTATDGHFSKSLGIVLSPLLHCCLETSIRYTKGLLSLHQVVYGLMVGERRYWICLVKAQHSHTVLQENQMCCYMHFLIKYLWLQHLMQSVLLKCTNWSTSADTPEVTLILLSFYYTGRTLLLRQWNRHMDSLYMWALPLCVCLSP